MSDDGGTVRSTWGEYAAAFAAEGAAAEDRESIRRLVHLCDLAPGSLVLDVATGAGFNAFAFVRAGMRVIPSDPTHEMLVATRDGWAERGFGGSPRLVEAWAESLPFGDATLDAVVAHRAPHQFSDPQAWAHEAHRVLKPGGIFGLSDQSPPDGFEQWHNDFERLRDPTHEQARSLGEWRTIAGTAGFTVRATDVVPNPHDVEEWIARVDCPPERRLEVLAMYNNAPPEIVERYGFTTVDERLKMSTPQGVLVATR